MPACPQNLLKCPRDKCRAHNGNLICQRRSELRTSFPEKQIPSQEAFNQLSAVSLGLAELIGRKLAQDFYGDLTTDKSGDV